MKLLPFLLLVAPVASFAAETNINAATIYAPAFSNINAWAMEHTLFSLAASNVALPEAQAVFRELSPQIRAMEGVEAASFVDWGTKFDEGFAAKLDYIGPSRHVIRAALWASAYAASNGLAGADRFALDALRVSRDVGEDRLLVSLLVQISGEVQALDRIEQCVGNMSVDQLDQLDRRLAAMPDGTSIAEAMQMEKAMFVNSLITKLVRAMESADTNLFEVVAADGGGTNVARVGASATTNAAAGGRWLAEHLRLTSIVDMGTGIKIGFDSDELGSFMISFGRPKFGIELLSADFDHDKAVIGRGTETALVRLKARDIVPFRLKLKMPKPGDENVEKNPLVALLAATSFADSDETEDAMRKEFLGDGTAEGLLKYLQRVSADYDQWIAAYKTKPPDGFKAWLKDFMKDATLLTRQLLPAVEVAIEREQKMTDARTKLAAAITSRRTAIAKKQAP